MGLVELLTAPDGLWRVKRLHDTGEEMANRKPIGDRMQVRTEGKQHWSHNGSSFA
jgi:hypothetical protein